MTWHIKTLVWQKSSDRDQNAPKVPDFRTHLTSPKFRMLWNLLRKAKFNRQFRASSVEVTKFKVAANSSEKLKRHDRVAKKIHSDETRVNTISMIHFLIRTESGCFIPLIIVFAEVLKISSNWTCLCQSWWQKQIVKK